ncbi:MAG: C40 family peptidase [Clostridia bacterium]|nr:C40 family peptidase [Clostridia bacterium]
MKRYLSVILVFICVVLMCCPAASAASFKAKINSSSSRIYKSPSSRAVSVKGVKNLTVNVTAYSGSWARVTYKGRVGYMPIKYLNLVNRIKAYTTGSVSVYRNAGSSSRLGTLPRGTTVYVIGVDGSYARIQDANGRVTGYIRASQLSKTRPATASSSVSTNKPAATNPPSTGSSTRVPASLQSSVSSYKSGMSKSQRIEYAIYVAQNLDGKPYATNANPPKTFNCSIFVNYCMGKAKISTKNNAASQSNDSSMDKITSISSLKRGDIVCFNTNAGDNDPVDHTGIYLGSGKFIHASSAAGEVRVDSLSSGFYKNCFAWARRP